MVGLIRKAVRGPARGPEEVEQREVAAKGILAVRDCSSGSNPVMVWLSHCGQVKIGRIWTLGVLKGGNYRRRKHQ